MAATAVRRSRRIHRIVDRLVSVFSTVVGGAAGIGGGCEAATSQGWHRSRFQGQ